jgi:hypothetical protein
VKQDLTKEVCIYGNPTLDIIEDDRGKRWSYGGGVYYTSLPFMEKGFKIKIYSTISHSIINHPVFKHVVPLQYSNTYNIFHIKYDEKGSRALALLQEGPPLYVWNMNEDLCVAIVNPVYREILPSFIKQLSNRSIILAGDVQGFLRLKRNHSIILYPDEQVFESIRMMRLVHMDIEEARALTSEQNIKHVAFKLKNIFDDQIIVVTNGPFNIVLVYDGRIEEVYHAGEPYTDTTGAGDFFLGSLTFYYLITNDIVESVHKSVVETEKWLTKKGFIATHHPVENNV